MPRWIALSTCTALALVLVPALASAQPLVYKPGTHRYKVVSELKQKATTSSRVSEMTATSTQHVTVTLAARADTIDFTIVVDSVRFSSVPAMTRAIDSTRGRTANGAMSPRGKLYRLTGADSAANGVARTFGKFFPELPANVAIGQSWTDTSITPLQPNGEDFGRITTVSVSRVSGDTTLDGVRAWKIERASDATGGGVRSSAAGEMVMQATLAARGTIYMGANGVYLGRTMRSTSTYTMTVAAAGLSVPLTQDLTVHVRSLGSPAGSP